MHAHKSSCAKSSSQEHFWEVFRMIGVSFFGYVIYTHYSIAFLAGSNHRALKLGDMEYSKPVPMFIAIPQYIDTDPKLHPQLHIISNCHIRENRSQSLSTPDCAIGIGVPTPRTSEDGEFSGVRVASVSTFWHHMVLTQTTNGIFALWLAILIFEVSDWRESLWLH